MITTPAEMLSQTAARIPVGNAGPGDWNGQFQASEEPDALLTRVVSNSTTRVNAPSDGFYDLAEGVLLSGVVAAWQFSRYMTPLDTPPRAEDHPFAVLGRHLSAAAVGNVLLCQHHDKVAVGLTLILGKLRKLEPGASTDNIIMFGVTDAQPRPVEPGKLLDAHLARLAFVRWLNADRDVRHLVDPAHPWFAGVTSCQVSFQIDLPRQP